MSWFKNFFKRKKIAPIEINTGIDPESIPKSMKDRPLDQPDIDTIANSKSIQWTRNKVIEVQPAILFRGTRITDEEMDDIRLNGYKAPYWKYGYSGKPGIQTGEIIPLVIREIRYISARLAILNDLWIMLIVERRANPM
jgi:hypothetical protein